MKFWCLKISQKANQILDKFLPYKAKTEICQKFGWLFGWFEDTKNSFWDLLTFRDRSRSFIRYKSANEFGFLSEHILRLYLWSKIISIISLRPHIWSRYVVNWFWNLIFMKSYLKTLKLYHNCSLEITPIKFIIIVCTQLS